MRIVTVLTSLGVGGAEKQALAVAERMAKRGHAVAVLVLMPPVAEEWPTTIRTVYLGVHKTPGSVLRGLMRARSFAREFRPDLAHSHSFHANLFTRLLRLLVPRLVVLSTVHSVNEGGWRRMMAYRLTDVLSRRTVAVSEAAARHFIGLKAVPRRKCLVVRNGIDIAGFAPDRERRERMRAETGVATATADVGFVWLAVGRIVLAKDYPNLLCAFAEVWTRRAEAQLWIAGQGQKSEISALQVLCDELSIGKAVRWLGLRRDIPALLDAADAFVSASAWEGMPLAVGEAMAMGKPVVATSVGGVGELLGDTGVAVPARNSHALAAAMIATMRQGRDELSARGRAARKRVLERFSVDASADAWEALYSSLIANREP